MIFWSLLITIKKLIQILKKENLLFGQYRKQIQPVSDGQEIIMLKEKRYLQKDIYEKSGKLILYK